MTDEEYIKFKNDLKLIDMIYQAKIEAMRIAYMTWFQADRAVKERKKEKLPVWGRLKKMIKG